jgi:ammonium transporter, Amt family
LTDKYLCEFKFSLWWGWIAFNAGSSYGVEDGKFQLAARAGAGTTLATMGAGATSLIISFIKNKGKINVSEVLFGIMSSLGNVIMSL